MHGGNPVSAWCSSLAYTWCMNTISRTLALLKPDDLFPAWKWIDIMEQQGEIEAGEARLWKDGIYGLINFGLDSHVVSSHLKRASSGRFP